ncbi:hypothetical protein GCM10027592_52960 [Spirosoma flavus]
MKNADIGKQNATIAVFADYQSFEDVIKKLQQVGYNMSKLSVVGQGDATPSNTLGNYPAGALWKGIKKLPLASAFFSIPEFGPFFVAGPLLNSLQNSLVTSLENDLAPSRTNAFETALVNVGIPRNFAFICESQIKTGHYLLIAHGTMKEVELANWVFGFTSPCHSPQELAAA